MTDHETEKAAYDLARETYAAEEDRFDDAESKINRYLSVLFVVLGASVVSVDLLRSLPWTSGNALFLVLVALFFVSGIAAFAYFLRALRVQRIRSLVLGREVVDYFSKFPLADALRGLAVGFFEAAAAVRAQSQAKIELAAKGYNFMLAAVIFAVLSGLSYYLAVDLPPGGGLHDRRIRAGCREQRRWRRCRRAVAERVAARRR